MKTPGLFFILLVCSSFAVYAQAQDWDELLRRRKFDEIIEGHRGIDPLRAKTGTLNLLAKAYEGTSNLRQAALFYKYCYQRDTSDTEYLFKISDALQKNGNFTEAQYYLRKVLSRDSTNTYAATQNALLDMQAGNPEKAAAELEKLLEKDSANAYLWYNLGICYGRMRLLLESVSAYAMSYLQDKSNEGVALAFINSLMKMSSQSSDAPTGNDSTTVQKEFHSVEEEIIVTCDSTLHYLPGNKRIRQMKGVALYKADKIRQADTLFAELLTEGDSSPVSLKYAGAIKYRLHDYLKAREYFEKHYRIDSMDHVVNLTYGSTLSFLGDPRGSFRLLDKVEKDIQPDKALLFSLYYYRATAYKRSSKRPEATRYYYKAWQIDPERYDLFYEIVDLYRDYKEGGSPENREIALFAAVSYVKEHLARGNDPERLRYYKQMFRYFHEDMFFKGQEYISMRSPLNEKSRISGGEITELIIRIPDRD